MRRILYLFTIVVLTSTILLSNEIDSLEKQLPKSEGIKRALILNKLGATYDPIDADKRLNYSLEALSLGNKYEIDSIIARATLNLALSYYYKSQTDSTIKYFEKSLELYQKLKDTARIAACLNNLGIMYNSIGNTDKAINYYLHSYTISEARNDSLSMTKVLNNIGSILSETDKIDLSIEYFEKALRIRLETDDSLNLPLSFHNLGWVYFVKAISFTNKEYSKNYMFLTVLDTTKFNDSTLKYLDLSLNHLKTSAELHKVLNNKVDYEGVMITIALIQYCLNNITESIRLLENAKEVLQTNQRFDDASRTYINLGFIYSKQKNYSKAVDNLLTGLKITEVTKNISHSIIAYTELVNIYKNMGNFEKALFYSEKLTNAKDSLYTAENIESINKLEILYNIQKKETELKLAEEREHSLQQHNVIYIVTILFMGIIIFGLYIIYNYKNKHSLILKNKNEELTELNIELEKSRLKLKEANDSKDKFFSIISHDLKNPVGSIKNLIELLADSYDNMEKEEQIEFLDILKKSTQRIYNLLDDLLTWSRTQINSIEIHIVTTYLYVVSNSALDNIIMNAKNKKIQIINNINKDIICKVDENMIITVFRNLVSNAVKFTNEGGAITINSIIDKEKNEIIVSISDNGIGMSEDIISKLFRIDNVIKQKGTNDEIGTGLGLIICKEFVDKNNGRMWVESEVGKGSTFYFTVPSAS